MDTLAELERLIDGMGADDLANLDKILAPELKEKWLPNPGPQTEAYYSKADLLLYGGAAGGGKSALIVGLAIAHQKVVIFRRSYGELSDIAETFLETIGTRAGFNGQDMLWRDRTVGKLVEFGALERPGSEKVWAGRPHDLIAFDEGAELSVEKISFVMGWLRSADPKNPTDLKQRCRVVIASNPPRGGDGAWIMEWFAPWLDPLFPNPAKDGELRWCIRIGNDTIWRDGPGQSEHDGETYTHESRTFVPALLDDNPYLKDTSYRSRIQNMPEPLRSQLLKGDFLAGREDHAWQVIPTEWVVAANERWRNAEQKTRPMLALSADVALGGGDDTSFSALHADAWFAPLVTRKDGDRADKSQLPAEIAAQMLLIRRNEADLSVDGTGGWGSGVRSHLVNSHGVECAALVYSGKPTGSGRTKDGKLGYKNLRAQLYWEFREALDPESGEDVKLPPDPRLFAELTAPRYKLVGTNIQIEDKGEIRDRVGSSPDRSDSVVQSWHRRGAAIRSEKRQKARAKMTPMVRGVGFGAARHG